MGRMIDYYSSIKQGFSNDTKALIDGQVVNYDKCGIDPNAYDGLPLSLTYLGEGVIYSVNGVLQNSDIVLHFWKLK